MSLFDVTVTKRAKVFDQLYVSVDCSVSAFYYTYSLVNHLGQNLTLLGTVRKTRKELPNEFVLKKRTAFESVFAFTEDTTLVSYAPKTNKTVVLLSTMHNKEEINAENEKRSHG